jgi:hypothetical protein
MAKNNSASSVTLNRNDKGRASSAHVVYDLPGGGQVYIPSSRISGEVPAQIYISGLVLTDGLARGGRKLTEEEKAARAEARKNMTPEQKAAVAQKSVERAQARLASILAEAK